MIYIYSNHSSFKTIANQLLYDLPCAKLKTSLDNALNSDLYIIFGGHTIQTKLPMNYIIIQLEQSTWPMSYFTDRYMNMLCSAMEVWDYSLINYQFINKFSKDINLKYVSIKYLSYVNEITDIELYNKRIYSKNTHDLAPYIYKKLMLDNTVYKYDIFFYGSNSDRRNIIINKLRAKYKVLFISSDISEEEFANAYVECKICINIHFNECDKTIMESSRIAYLLSIGLLVVSEVSCDPIADRFYSDYAVLCKTSDIEETIHNVLNNNLRPKLYGQFNKTKTIWPNIVHLIKQYDASDNLSRNNNELIESDCVTEIFKKAEAEVSHVNNNIILKLPYISYEDLPDVSIVILVHNRQHLQKLIEFNIMNMDYPRNKMEIIIVDDSDVKYTISLITGIKKLNHIKCNKTSISNKRNLGIDSASSDIIAFMDDDDYYYPTAIQARVKTLLKYKNENIKCVGTNILDMYDIVNNFSATINSKTISEASMAFFKDFYTSRKFSDHPLGEGYAFLDGRYAQVITIPSRFNLIAITHASNISGASRSHTSFSHLKQSDDALKLIDDVSRKFLLSLQWST
jgi:hypothetical protein